MRAKPKAVQSVIGDWQQTQLQAVNEKSSGTTAPMIEYTELAPDLTIPRILTGLWPLAGLDGNDAMKDVSGTENGLDPYIKAGSTCFDMAGNGGPAEEIVRLLRSGEADGPSVQLLTHWVPRPGKLGKQDVREAVESILGRLQVDRLDLLQYHAWNYSDPVWLDSLFWLQELREEGMIRYLGLCDFDAAHLRMALASGIDIRSNQICYSLFDQLAAADMREAYEQSGVKILAWGTLAGGFISDRWLGQAEPEKTQLTGRQQQNYERLIARAGGWSEFQHVLSVLSHVAARHRISIAAVSSRYMLDQPGVAGIILGAGSEGVDPLKEYTAIFSAELDQDDRERLEVALSYEGFED